MSLLIFRNHPATLRVVIVLCVGVIGWMGFRAYGWAGVALAAGGICMWLLLNMSRMLMVLRRSAQRPIGSVASAVMLHARLHRGMSLLQVLALSRSLGVREGTAGGPSEEYRWTDQSGAQVRCTFDGGRLTRWELLRDE